jgi:hypothetical protein
MWSKKLVQLTVLLSGSQAMKTLDKDGFDIEELQMAMDRSLLDVPSTSSHSQSAAVAESDEAEPEIDASDDARRAIYAVATAYFDAMDEAAAQRAGVQQGLNSKACASALQSASRNDRTLLKINNYDPHYSQRRELFEAIFITSYAEQAGGK